MFGLGTTELIIILVIVMVIFGAGKLPELGSGLGRGIRNFKRSMKGQDEIDVTPEQAEQVPPDQIAREAAERGPAPVENAEVKTGEPVKAE